MTTFAEIKNEIAKRKPEELPVVLRDINTSREVFGFRSYEITGVENLYCVNMATGEPTYWSEDTISGWEILPPPKEEKVMYQVVYKTSGDNRWYLSTALYRDKEHWLEDNRSLEFHLLTDRPIKLEE